MLLPEDLLFAANAENIMAKNRIIREAYNLFGQLAENYQTAAQCLPKALLKQHPKISKGENYLGIPWVLLDYPRNFIGPDVFAIRTIFWWGNYFSLQILLQGKCMEMLNIAKLKQSAAVDEWFFCIDNDRWQHHFKDDYMIPVSTLTPEIANHQRQENKFYKIGIKLPVGEWNRAEAFFALQFNIALAMLHQNQDM